jgi:hypothetical protein
MAIIIIPALGRMNRPSIDFPALHWPKSQIVNDVTLLNWAENLRRSWNLLPPHGTGDPSGYLSNYAINWLIKQSSEDILKQNRQRIMKLLGDC